ncbi:uracil-DNA glycosylase-like protein [Zychaea mexicana]|uniref:uracil-DNA glycosylase-like protein n=1 Tax=Zychaea mexicana TaxID=64656 RepID=UPI0022FE3EB6|nr:uracil-DNA glycosylase-like protein [Zychaea mexicana]KAI9467492.1 uracil-DNA glycosylase-like protein [Zychaea mexicana]
MLPALLYSDLFVLFVGINPDLDSSASGHFYEGRSNHFWHCLNATDLVSYRVSPKDDSKLPRDFGLGFTNICRRPTRTAKELHDNEIVEGLEVLKLKIERYQPAFVCFLGIDMYKKYIKKRTITPRLQKEKCRWGAREHDVIRFFVMPSTSARVVAFQRDDKVKLFQELSKEVELFRVATYLLTS